MKTTAENYTGEQKDIVRESTITSGKIYKNVICLPGPKCLGVIKNISNGSFDENTVITVIERYNSSRIEIQNKFKKFPFKKVNFPPAGLVEETPNYGPYDLIDLDTCSSLDYPMLHWIRKQTFLPDGEINVWLTSYRNNQGFRDALLHSFLETRLGLDVFNKMKRAMIDVFELDSYDPVQLVTAAAIFAALRKYDCRIKPLVRYCEHVNFMYVYRFTHLNEKIPTLPSLENVIRPNLFSEKTTWQNTTISSKLSDEKRINMIIKAVQGTSGMKAYTTRQLRLEIANGLLSGKASKWIKAGWKSYLSRVCENQLKQETHKFIDAI